MKNIKAIFTLSLLLTFVFIFTSTSFAQKPTAMPSKANKGMTRSCDTRLNAVKTRMAQLVRLSVTQRNTFESITDRVISFYTDKVAPQGITVTNYDTLIGEISTKKTAVDNAVSKAQADLNGYNCTNGNPKVNYTSFRQNMQAVKSALKEYRTAIKNLIVAVHSSLPDEGASATVTPTPTL